MSNKAELRKIFKLYRSKLTKTEVEDLSKAIVDQFFSFFDLSEIKYFHSFMSIERHNEPNTQAIVKEIWKSHPHIQIGIPKVDPETEEFDTIEYEVNTKLMLNKLGIPEPVSGNYLDESLFDIILVPMLTCDTEGNRIGYGKGFYDRFLTRCKGDCIKVGLSFTDPIEERIESDEWDIGLDFCITPKKVIDFHLVNNK